MSTMDKELICNLLFLTLKGYLNCNDLYIHVLIELDELSLLDVLKTGYPIRKHGEDITSILYEFVLKHLNAFIST
jgi:hypothetical protein